jgi:NACalpha-BTF3-like transcription factor
VTTTQQQLKLHPIVQLFPKVAGEEREGMRRDIQNKGVLVPIIVKEGYIIDGQNRYDICQELGIECPVTEFPGSFEEAIAYVVSLNLQRRQLNSSQRAAVAVEADALNKKFQKKEKKERKKHAKENGTQEEEEDKGDEGDIAQLIADEAGTNRTYVFKARELKKEFPDLLARVRDGELTIPQAEKEAGKRRRQQENGEGEDGQTEGQEGEDGEDEEELLDQLGNKVPRKFRQAFLGRTDFMGAVKAIKSIKDQVKEVIQEGPGAFFLPAKEVNAALDDAARLLRQSQPHCLCPKCKGRGCNTCKDQGWMHKVLYDGWVAEQKKKDKEKAAKEKLKQQAQDSQDETEQDQEEVLAQEGQE